MKISTLRKALILLAVMIAVAIPAAALSGSGTSADPYVITSSEELMKMTGSSYYKLGKDIVINDVSKFTFEDGVITEANGANAWTPIENFSGTFDGANYYITGLYVTEDNENGGLFATLTNATIQNVNLEFALVESDECAGILAAKAEGTTTITNCMVSGSVIGKTTKEMNTVGGLVGYVGADATVSNSVSYATVTGATSYSMNVGGLVGFNQGTVTTSGYYGKVYGTATYYDAAIGGIAGYNVGSIDNCRVAGTIGGESTALVNDCFVGGVAGANKGTVEYCNNSAEISIENYSSGDSICAAGGIVGATIDADVARNTNSGAVTGEYSYCGGIAGVAISDTDTHSVEYCDNTGAVTSKYGVAGGIVGRAVAAGEGYVSIKLNVNNCYNTGKLSGNAYDEIAGETATVESASVTLGVECGSANGYTSSAKNTSTISAEAEQYGKTATATGVGTMTQVSTAIADKYIIRYTGDNASFAPAPVVVTLTVVSDASKVEILSVDASGLTLTDGKLSGTVVVKVYTPNAATNVQAVVGTSIDNKYADTKFSAVDSASGRIDDVEVTINTTVASLAEGTTGPINVNVLVVGTTANMDPVCENMEVTK